MAIVYGAVAEELSRRFGGLMRDEPSVVTIGAAVGNVIGRDPERFFLVIVNLSANDVYVAPLSNPSTTNGIKLDANGGSVSVNVDQDGSLPSLEWNGIATGAGSSVFTLSVRRDTAHPRT